MTSTWRRRYWCLWKNSCSPAWIHCVMMWSNSTRTYRCLQLPAHVCYFSCFNHWHYITTGMSMKYCDQRVCLSVCLLVMMWSNDTRTHRCLQLPAHVCSFSCFYHSHYFTTGRSTKYCDQRVCLSVCLLVQISPNILCKLTGRGSVHLWRQCNMLCTSGFVDDVMFSYNAGNRPESKTTCMLYQSSPDGGTGGIVCRLCLLLVLVRM